MKTITLAIAVFCLLIVCGCVEEDHRAPLPQHVGAIGDGQDTTGVGDVEHDTIGTIEDLCRSAARDICRGSSDFERCAAAEYAQCLGG